MTAATSDQKAAGSSGGGLADECKKALEYKEAGNAAYKAGECEDAIIAYTKAIDLSGDANDEKTLAICLKNRAAVHLKEEDYDAVVRDCTRSLKIVPNDPKALFRRCQAYKGLNQVDSAYKDAREVYRVDQNNRAIQPILVRLRKAISMKVGLKHKL